MILFKSGIIWYEIVTIDKISPSLRKKVSVFGVILVYVFPAFSRIRREYGEIPYSVRMRENAGKMRTRITPDMDNFYAVHTFVITLTKL